MYCVRTIAKGAAATDKMFEDLDKAVQYFKESEKMGLNCALYNFN